MKKPGMFSTGNMMPLISTAGKRKPPSMACCWLREMVEMRVPTLTVVITKIRNERASCNRAPPDEDCQIDPRVDQYYAIDPPSPED